MQGSVELLPHLLNDRFNVLIIGLQGGVFLFRMDLNLTKHVINAFIHLPKTWSIRGAISNHGEN